MDFTISPLRRCLGRLAVPAVLAVPAFMAVPAVLAAAVATGTPAAASAAAGHGQAPPLVTDNMGSPFPCNQKSQLGVDGCAQRKLAAADKVLNGDITVLWGLLPGAQEKHDFSAGQHAWVSYRKADCISQSDVYQGGTAQPMEYLLCLAADDASRRQDLHGFYSLLTQGITHPPKFP